MGRRCSFFFLCIFIQVQYCHPSSLLKLRSTLNSLFWIFQARMNRLVSTLLIFYSRKRSKFLIWPPDPIMNFRIRLFSNCYTFCILRITTPTRNKMVRLLKSWKKMLWSYKIKWNFLDDFISIYMVANSEVWGQLSVLSDADLNYIVSQIYNQIFKLVWTSIQWKAA